MIPDSKISEIIKALKEAIGISVILADQSGHKPSYPYVSYKLISSQEESAHQNIRNVSGSGQDAIIKTYEKSKAVLSFTFMDKENVSSLYTYATLALQWFKSVEGMETCKAQEIAVQIISPTIEDRTVYLDSFFENRIGFDVRFDYTGSPEETIEAIETITITPTVDEVVGSDIVITEE